MGNVSALQFLSGLFVCVWLCWQPSVVSASPFDTHGFGARASGLANAAVSLQADPIATYYNPAGLSAAPDVVAQVGFDVIRPRLYARFDNPGVDDNPASLPLSNAALHAGLLIPSHILFDSGLSVGFGLSSPLIQATRIDAPALESPHFYRYHSQSDALTFITAVAYRGPDWLSIGAAYHIIGGLDGQSTVEIDLFSRRISGEQLEAQVNPGSAFSAGVTLAPNEVWRLALSYRQAIDLPYSLTSNIELTGISSISATLFGRALYRPSKLSIGTLYRPLETLSLMVQLDIERWHQAPDPSTRFEGFFDGSNLGFDETTLQDQSIALGAVDTYSPRLGVEYTVAPQWVVRAGYSFLPTPLPAQTSVGNYADADTHQVGLGATYAFANGLAPKKAPLSVSISFQCMQLEARQMDKQNELDGVGDYAVGGRIWHAALTFDHRFQ
ncbi:MAG: OmpP1/FadL family transporter [Bradymonadia bacterium]